ncbi:MAG: GHKL domain-containing protein [Acutalibacter sp.]
MIQGYLATGDREALGKYLQEYGMSSPADPGKPYCQNFALDTIFRYYGKKAGKTSIRFDTHLDLPQTLPIPEPDLCVVCGNLLENALEACEGLPDAFIRAAANLSNGWLSLMVDNSAAQGLWRKTESSSPPNIRGLAWGPNPSKTLPLNTAGSADFRWEDGTFCASVALNTALSSDQKSVGGDNSPTGAL